MSDTVQYKIIESASQVTVRNRRVNTDYKWHDIYTPKKSCFSFWGKPEAKHNVFVSVMCGYDTCYEVFHTKEEVLAYKFGSDDRSKFLIEDNVVYYRPYVHIEYSRRGIDSDTIYFDTFEEAKKWAQDFIDNNGLSDKLIKMEI